MSDCLFQKLDCYIIVEKYMPGGGNGIPCGLDRKLALPAAELMRTAISGIRADLRSVFQEKRT